MIQLSFKGADGLDINADGDLVLRTPYGDLVQRRPFTYQEYDGARREVTSDYVLLSDKSVGFRLGVYDASRPLVIDPVVSYSTYLGGMFFDEARGVAVDSAGAAYVVGGTSSPDFPVSNPLQAPNAAAARTTTTPSSPNSATRPRRRPPPRPLPRRPRRPRSQA